MRGLVKVGVGAVVAALVLAACGGDGESTAPESSTSTPSSTTTTFDREAEEQAVIDAYLAQLDAYYQATNPPDPNHPALDDYATGKLLRSVKEAIAEFKDKGIAINRGDLTQNRPEVIKMSARYATVKDCVTDNDIQYDLATSDVIDDKLVHAIFTAQLIKSGGRWKVAERTFELLEEPCAA